MISQALQTELIAAGTIAFLSYVGGVLTSGKVKPLIKRGIAYAVNTEIHISVERRDIFNSVDQEIDLSRFSSSIFHAIRDQYDGEVTNPNINGRILTLTVDNIPNRVSIKLDEERGIRGSSIDEESIGYRLGISPEGDLRFGYRTTDSLEEFERFADEIKNIVQSELFPGTQPTDSHVDVRVKKGVPALSGEVENKKLGISAHLDGGELRMTMRNPSNLARGIKKFLSPR